MFFRPLFICGVPLNSKLLKSAYFFLFNLIIIIFLFVSRVDAVCQKLTSIIMTSSGICKRHIRIYS